MPVPFTYRKGRHQNRTNAPTYMLRWLWGTWCAVRGPVGVVTETAEIAA